MIGVLAVWHVMGATGCSFSVNLRLSVDLQLELFVLRVNRLKGSLPSSWSSMVQVCTCGHLY